MAPSERLAWTADRVAPAPGDRVLEVGCGHGVLVSLLAARLTTGVVIGVDRSSTMTAAAARRNAADLQAGRVRLVTAPLVEADLGEQRFDVVVSVNVRAFWTAPAPEWDALARLVAPGGRVLVAWSVMGRDTVERVREEVHRLAGARGFVPAGLHRGETAPTGTAAIELRVG